MQKIEETQLIAKSTVPSAATDAARAAFDAGGSPRQQIDAARKATGKKLVYLPHQGKRQRERALLRMAKQASV